MKLQLIIMQNTPIFFELHAVFGGVDAILISGSFEAMVNYVDFYRREMTRNGYEVTVKGEKIEH